MLPDDGFTVERIQTKIDAGTFVLVDETYLCKIHKSCLTWEQANAMIQDWNYYGDVLCSSYCAIDPIAYDDWHDDQKFDVNGRMDIRDAKNAAYLKLVYGGNL